MIALSLWTSKTATDQTTAVEITFKNIYGPCPFRTIETHMFVFPLLTLLMHLQWQANSKSMDQSAARTTWYRVCDDLVRGVSKMQFFFFLTKHNTNKFTNWQYVLNIYKKKKEWRAIKYVNLGSWKHPTFSKQ